MEIQYRRNFHESYMIMEAPDGSDFYEERMMRRNDIPYLLSFRRMEVNGKAQLWYDITGMESLRDRMRRQGVSAEGAEGSHGVSERGMVGDAPLSASTGAYLSESGYNIFRG